MLRNFCAGVSTHLGRGLGLLMVTSLPGVNPNPPSGLILVSTAAMRVGRTAGGRHG